MPVEAPENGRPYLGLFGPSRNTFISKWDLLFEKDPKEWIAFKPALGLHVYPCYACRHMFYSKRSFLYHINRRAVVLTYNCPHCPEEKLTFYNRCAFLVHVRKHFTLQSGSINLNYLSVSRLPFGLAGFTKDPDIPFLFDVEEEYNNADVFVNSQFYAARYEDRGKEIVVLTPSNLVINKTSPNGEIQALSVLQIAKNIPKCQFILLEHLNRLRRQSRHSEEFEIQVKPEPVQEEPEPELGNLVINEEEQPEEEVPQMTLPVITKIESVDESFAEEVNENTSSRKAKTYECPECKKHLNMSLINHFLAENKPASINFKCNQCRLICSSACSYSAHIRIHKRKPPFICPDCGQEFKEFADLNTHIDDICFHISKSVRYRCPKYKCAKLFASSQTYSPHFALHMETSFKCVDCQIFFEDFDKADEHASYQEDPKRHRAAPMYQCTVCSDGQFYPEMGCKNHIDWHMNDLNRCLYIYLCKYCKSYFRSTATYAAHLVKCSILHQSKVVRRRRRVDKPFFASKYETGECTKCKTRIIYAKARPVDTCRKCIYAQNKAEKQNGEDKLNSPPNNKAYNSDKTSGEESATSDREKSNDKPNIAQDQNGLSPKRNETSKLTRLDTDNQDAEQDKEKTPVPNALNVYSKLDIPGKSMVPKFHVKQQSENVVCVLCKMHMNLHQRKEHQKQCRFAKPEVWVTKFDTRLMNGKPILKVHPLYSDLDSCSGNQSYLIDRHSLPYSGNQSWDRHPLYNSPSKPKRRRVIRPKRSIETAPDLTADKPIEFDGVYSCKLCDFKDAERDKFHEHVRTHRQLSTAYQCMECGECFVVKRALIIHIQHFHNIHDYETYFEQNDCFDKEAVKELAKHVQLPDYARRNNVKENQCKVCLEEFATKQTHDTHFRIHGMAFLMQKK